MDAVYDIGHQEDTCKTVCLAVRVAQPHGGNNVAWKNGNIGFAYRAESRISDRTCLSAKSGPARRNPDCKDLIDKGLKFHSWVE